jgi:hypothetical protein
LQAKDRREESMKDREKERQRERERRGNRNNIGRYLVKHAKYIVLLKIKLFFVFSENFGF